MTYLETMDDLRSYIHEHTILESTKKICLGIYGNASVFVDPDSSLNECEKWIAERSDANKNDNTFALIVSRVKDIYGNFSEFEHLYTILEDDESKKVLINLLAHRLIRDDYYLLNAFSAGERQYFGPDFMKYKPKGIFVDCGALNGATTLEYSLHVPDFKRAYVYEPLPKMYEACVKNLSFYEASRIIVRQAAVSERKGMLHFDPFIEGSSHISETGALEVPSISLDEDISEQVDFIKMDIEGAEQAAIRGAKKHIHEDRPILAISVYHLPEDLHAIPHMIMELCPNYRFYLRHHMTDTNETIFYAIPQEILCASDALVKKDYASLAELLVDEYMHVQLLQKDYFLYILKLLSDAKAAHAFFEAQYKSENEAHKFFEQQFNVEKEAHSFFEQQFNVEKEAHSFFEQQFNAEKKAHNFFKEQFDAEATAHAETKKVLDAEKEAHLFFEQQYNVEKEAHDFFEQQFKAAEEAHNFFKKQFDTEVAAHAETKKVLDAEKEAHDFFEQQLHSEKEAHAFFKQQLNYANENIESIQRELEHQEEQVKKLEENIRSLKNDNAKLQYKLQVLKNDSFIRRIIKFRKYDV